MGELSERLVFISHSRQNAAAALNLSELLREQGFSVWLDLLETGSGLNWRVDVATAVATSSAFIFLIGPPTFNDPWQRFEWQQVADNEKYLDPFTPMIPILIEESQIPGFLNDRPTIHISGPSIDFDDLLDRVLTGLLSTQFTGTLREPIRIPEGLREYTRKQEENLARERLAGFE